MSLARSARRCGHALRASACRLAVTGALFAAALLYASSLRRRAAAGGGGGGGELSLRAFAFGGDAATSARDRSYARWSDTFGRTLRFGDGPRCTADSDLARRSALTLHDVPQRIEFGDYLNAIGAMGDGAELGVQRGEFSYELLSRWTNCSRYFLVDPWAPQGEAYVDKANVAQEEQDAILESARHMLSQWADKTVWVRARSDDAVARFEDCSLDWVYVDADHSFQGALADLVDWWPKLRPGGVMAGHDFLTGILAEGATGIFGVRDAAERFATAVNAPLYVTSPELDGDYRSFWLLKPPR